MNVLVIGAAGETGKLVVERAAAAGHAVTALVHDAGDYHAPAGVVRVVGGDARDAAAVGGAVAGQEAVVDALGGKTPYLETDLERSAARVIVSAMAEHGVRRLIVISVLGAGDSTDQAGFFYEHLLVPTYLRGVVKDKDAMEDEVRASGLDFVLVRPPVLKNGEAKGSVKVLGAHETAGSITRADLAAFLVDQLTSDAHVGQAVTVAND